MNELKEIIKNSDRYNKFTVLALQYHLKNYLKMKILIVYSYILHTYFRIKMGLKIL